MKINVTIVPIKYGSVANLSPYFKFATYIAQAIPLEPKNESLPR